MATVIALATGFGLISMCSFYVVWRDHRQVWSRLMYDCTLEFARHVPETGRIVVNGGRKYDDLGRSLAHNESMVFAWMDRKGFNYAAEDLGYGALDGIASRGGRYWMAHRDEADALDLIRRDGSRYRCLVECQGAYYLFDLRRAHLETPRNP